MIQAKQGQLRTQTQNGRGGSGGGGGGRGTVVVEGGGTCRKMKRGRRKPRTTRL